MISRRHVWEVGCLWGLSAAAAAGQDAGPRALPATPPAGLAGAEKWHASGQRGAVAAGGAEAVAAGMELLRAGGNAADAAAATILALSVTDASLFCFGGEVPILVYDAKRGHVEVIAGQGTAPRLATREHFAPQGTIPLKGIESAAVPGTLDACTTLLERNGTRSFEEAVAPTLRILDRHEQAWHADLARTIRILIAAEQTTTDRRQGLRRVSDAFYRGDIARRIDAWSRANGGLLRFEDLATHVTRIEDPVTATYRGRTIVKCGAWTQGPMLLETLQLLEGFDLTAAGPNSTDTIHLATEALKLGLADRDVYYADPLFVEVPIAGLLDPSYTAARRALIDPRHASLEQRPGDPRNHKALLEETEARRGLGNSGADTTTCVVADAAGNVVAATPSGWSGVLAGDTGVWLGSRLQSFNVWEGHPNCIAPGKRPRITLTPTLVLQEGKPVAAVSVAGGDLQDQTILQVLLNLLDFRMDPAQAVTAPRFSTDHHLGSFGQKPPRLGNLNLNPGVGEATIQALRDRGHQVELVPTAIAAPVALRIDPASGRIEAAGDPRAGRHADAD